MPYIDKQPLSTSFVPLRFLQDWGATIVGAICAVGLVLEASLTNVDIIQVNLWILSRLQQHSVEDVVVGIFLIFAGLAVDRWLSNRRRKRQIEFAEQRLEVLQATMRTVQDILNNFLNSLQLFRLKAEGVLSERTLKDFDDLIQSAAAKIRDLGNVEAVIEKQMATGIGIQFVPTTMATEHPKATLKSSSSSMHA